ncbi:DMT family transporter [Marinomonas balearica]|uniref:Threonine/homoserine efflux transporter RhtA n=1 Tax=Marinomonas balearica TaxID=491947 RepID=A0A4R6MAM7_9GAMM|nr:DMT family transporter [Marinomonas balearica]TDO98135.1 threonine/homoserine efflux transporter RhtA [Marinomonas balearica]
MFKGASLKAELILVLVTILAAFGWIFSKESLHELPPLFFISTRFILAGFILTLVSPKSVLGMNRKGWKHASFVGGLMGLAMMFWIIGLDQIQNIGVGAFISSLGVVLVPLVARLVFKDSPPTSIWFALPFAIMGLAFLSLGSLQSATGFEFAQLYFFIAAVFLALQFTFLSKLSTTINSFGLTAVQLFVTGVMILIVSLLTEEVPSSVSLSTLGWFFASVFIATTLRFLLQTYGMSLASASHAAIIMNLEPVWTALFAVLWYSERMSGWQLVGCVFVFISMLVSKWSAVRSFFQKKRPSQ